MASSRKGGRWRSPSLLLWNSGASLWGGYRPSYGGTFAEWVTGGLTAAGLLIAGYQVRAERLELREAEELRRQERQDEKSARRLRQDRNISVIVTCIHHDKNPRFVMSVTNSSSGAVHHIRLFVTEVGAEDGSSPLLDETTGPCLAGEAITGDFNVGRPDARGLWPLVDETWVSWRDHEDLPVIRRFSVDNQDGTGRSRPPIFKQQDSGSHGDTTS